MDYFRKERFGTLAEATEFAFSLGEGWIFRGQSCANWGLTTSLERAALGFDLPLSNIWPIEKQLIEKFARHMHIYLPNPPSRENVLEILALMQHHGAPTRLLDWTYSVYPAGYFAFESNCQGSDCAIWAINYKWCNQESENILEREFGDVSTLKKDGEGVQEQTVFRSFFWKRQIPLVYQLTPHRLSQRLVIQQGTFLWPGDSSRPFEENLRAIRSSKDNVVKISMDGSPKARTEALGSLSRMNINSATLFPGFDGFAASFRTELPFKRRSR
jgi:FRG domain-containing protein